MRFSIRTKLLVAFGVVVALMLGLGVFALTRLSSEDQHLRRLAAVVVPSTRAVGDISALMNKYREDQLHYIVAGPKDRAVTGRGSIQRDLGSDLSQIGDSLLAYQGEGLIEDTTDGTLLSRITSDFYRYTALTGSYKGLADQGLVPQAADAVGTGAGNRQWDVLMADIAAWNKYKVTTAQQASAASVSGYDASWRLIIALLAVAVVIAVTIAVVLARRMSQAVGEIGAAAKAIAEGDIDQRVVPRSHDELGKMAADFDGMIRYLGDTISIAQTIASGDLNVDVRPYSERDALGHALVAMTTSLRRVSAENAALLEQMREEADTDALTGLPNRRALMRDLDSALGDCCRDSPLTLALFDLDGFKEYNDTFGHPAGDALLVRLGDRLRRTLDGVGAAYRMGGDEFCILTRADEHGGATLVTKAAQALTETGEAFKIGCSYGIASVPMDASSPGEALRVADDRMYESKSSRVSASRQSTDVLIRVLSERNPGMLDHLGEVAELAELTARALALPEVEVRRIKLAAQLHDVGKVAIPDTILNKPGPLDEEEWAFIRRHTEIGERITGAAPSLANVAGLVRSTHERYDGRGYPDRLKGEEIPLGACVIGVCDAYDAMTSARPYSAPISVADALAELRRCSGTQFNPVVVDAFCALIESSDAEIPRAA